MKKFNQESILKIYNHLEKELQYKEKITFLAPNPDRDSNTITLKAWVDLAELLKCKMQIPKEKNGNIELTFIKLDSNNSFHTKTYADKTEKYGINSIFFNLNKNKEPYFVYSYQLALKLVDVKNRKNILNLGINKGDEFLFIKELIPNYFNNLNLTGIDHSKSAIEYAKQALPYPNCTFLTHDITKLKELNLPKQDLIISIGTMQSPSINFKLFLMELVQEHLSITPALILAFPNSRWIDNTLIYGAKNKNHNFSEMGLLINDLAYAKKYLQQKKFRVYITGREYIFLTAYKQ